MISKIIEPYKKLEYALINNKELGGSDSPYLKQTNGIQHLRQDLHLFHIDESLTQVLLNTKNKIYFRKLPFGMILLDCDLKIRKHRIQGIIITELSGSEWVESKTKQLKGFIKAKYPGRLREFEEKAKKIYERDKDKQLMKKRIWKMVY